MIDVRKFNSLGHAEHGWLNARHHFSFANYHDPKRMSWGSIRVWNDDEIAANSGFPPHPHRDMEIVTYVLDGAIEHQDSLGNKGVIRPGRTGAGDVQVMSAGTGVTHAEYNLEDEATTLFQIWIETDKPSADPSWGAMPFPKESRNGAFQLLASGDKDDGVLTINADARVLGAVVDPRLAAPDPRLGEPRRHLRIGERGVHRLVERRDDLRRRALRRRDAIESDRFKARHGRWRRRRASLNGQPTPALHRSARATRRTSCGWCRAGA